MYAILNINLIVWNNQQGFFDLDRKHIWIITQEFQEVECIIFVHLIFKQIFQNFVLQKKRKEKETYLLL